MSHSRRIAGLSGGHAGPPLRDADFSHVLRSCSGPTRIHPTNAAMTSEFPLTLEGMGERAEERPGGTLSLDEQTFNEFYAKTSPSLLAYLSRVSGNRTVAHDLLQEAYYHFLRTRLPGMDNAGTKSYLFRIATNLLRDHFRAAKRQRLPLPEAPPDADASERIQLRSDLEPVFLELKPRERELLWLAYVEGYSHQEVAEILGLKALSIRLLLSRCRRKLARMLRERGLGPED